MVRSFYSDQYYAHCLVLDEILLWKKSDDMVANVSDHFLLFLCWWFSLFIVISIMLTVWMKYSFERISWYGGKCKWSLSFILLLMHGSFYSDPYNAHYLVLDEILLWKWNRVIWWVITFPLFFCWCFYLINSDQHNSHWVGNGGITHHSWGMCNVNTCSQILYSHNCSNLCMGLYVSMRVYVHEVEVDNNNKVIWYNDFGSLYFSYVFIIWRLWHEDKYSCKECSVCGIILM